MFVQLLREGMTSANGDTSTSGSLASHHSRTTHAPYRSTLEILEEALSISRELDHIVAKLHFSNEGGEELWESKKHGQSRPTQPGNDDQNGGADDEPSM